MLIGIDGHDLEGKRTGVGRYLMSILRAWEHAGALREHRVVLFFKSEVPKDLPAGVETQLLPPILGKQSTALFVHAILPLAAKRAKIDVLFCPGYVAPMWLPRRRSIATWNVLSKGERLPIALTLHDIIYEARPELFNFRSPADKFLLAYVSKRAAHRAARVLVPSHFTAQEVMRHYGLAQSTIVVTPLAADEAFRPLPDKPSMRTLLRQYGVTGPYLLYVGSMFSRRHIPECLDAFVPIAQEFPQHQFLLAGQNYTKPFVDIDARIQRLNAKLRRTAIVRVPYAKPEHLPALYSMADATVWLSTYEGFGLPPLESLACATPVITTRLAALPETVGSCAQFVDDPTEPNAITKAIRELLHNTGLRERLAYCGPQQAAKFSWDRCAAQTLQALWSAAAPHAR